MRNGRCQGRRCSAGAGNRSGMAYVLVLLLVLLVSSLGFAFAFGVRTHTLAATGRRDALQAAYLAESAANHAMWRLLNDPVPLPNMAISVAASSDDASQPGWYTDAVIDETEIGLGEKWMVGLRFTGVAISNGTAIASVRVQFMASASESGDTDIMIFGEAADDAQTFERQGRNLSRRNRTAVSVSWHDIPVWQKDNFYETPDLSGIIEEIINRPGWQSGNALVLLFRSDNPGGKRLFWSYDKGTATPARLLIAAGDTHTMGSAVYIMHSLAGGRYGYKVRRHTDATFATIATVGAAGDSVAHQSYVLYVKR